LVRGGASPRHRAVDPADPTPGLFFLTERATPSYALGKFWRADEDDEIGGWCVVINRPGTPARGNPSLGNFMHREHAEHIAELHNEWLDRKVRNR
jgi:hypothetical protein